MAEIKPKGVQLIDPMDFKTHRQRIFDKVLDATKASFPRKFGGVRMELGDDIGYEKLDDFKPEEITRALLEDRSLSHKLRGTVRLYDDATNDLLDEKHMTLANVPWLSDRGTFTRGGNNYTSIMQQRLSAGPYGRVMDNGQVETHFNVKPGSGPGFRVLLEPDTAQFRLRVGPQSAIHLYSVLKDMGVPDDHLKETWGEGTWQRNAEAYNPKAFDQAYTRLVPAREQQPDATVGAKAAQLHAAFNRSQILSSIRDTNLPSSNVKRAALNQQLRATDYMDQRGSALESHFTPDFSPEDLREEFNAIYGKHGPRLASMQRWPDNWINHNVDPLGWLEWFQNFHGGRRSEDDDRQIKRWMSFRNRQLALFKNNPTARRGFALRNWAIDGVKHLPADQQQKVRRDMSEYKGNAWAQWMAKKASLDLQDLQALARYLNHHGANLYVGSDKTQLENAIRQYVLAHVGVEEVALGNAAQSLKAMKTAFLVHDAFENPDIYTPADVNGACYLKTAYGAVDLSEHAEIVNSIIECRSLSSD